MDKTVPAGAALLLDFIGDIEAPRGYGTIYANKQHRLKTPLTSMTLGDVIDAQPGWTRAHGSSAAGRYQFMRATLIGLSKEMHLRGNQTFDADLQDRLAFHLLKRRGYEAYMRGEISRTEFGKRLAMEWASLPVLNNCKGSSRELQRGQSYYAGDGLNKSLIAPEQVEAVLDRVRVAGRPAPVPVPEPRPLPDDPGVEQDVDAAPDPVSRSKRFWTWLTTGGGTAVLPFVDWRVQFLIVVVVVGFAVYAIATMPAVRKKLGLA